jgi:hypothetical protein
VIQRLKNAGFSNTEISVLFPHASGTSEFSQERATKAPEGATTGGTTGFVVGGVLGWLAGIGSLAIPGIGPFIAAGPILAALSGAAVGAAVGGIAGALIGMGIPEYEARQYESRIKEGLVLISVHAESDVQSDRAKAILIESHAEDVAISGEPQLPPERTREEAQRKASTETPPSSGTSATSSGFPTPPHKERPEERRGPGNMDPGI